MNLAIFASGNGSNAQKIIEYFSDNKSIRVALILSNNSNAFVLKRAENYGIPSFVFTFQQLKKTEIVQQKLCEFNIDFIVLAGFMLMIPPSVLELFPHKIVNIHPALLPKYGGKGMYGENVHKAVIASRERESGITIHYVNEHYDEGHIIFQSRCEVDQFDTAETLAARIHQLEFEHYPKIIEKVILQITNS